MSASKHGTISDGEIRDLVDIVDQQRATFGTGMGLSEEARLEL